MPSANIHSHAGAWERGWRAVASCLWFPRSPVGTATEPEREYGAVADMDMPVCIPTEDRGNEGMHSHAKAWERV